MVGGPDEKAKQAASTTALGAPSYLRVQVFYHSFLFQLDFVLSVFH